MNKLSCIIIACYPDKGMKSYGSKSLIDFNNKRLLQHQIDIIKNIKDIEIEIIVISDFETNKLIKQFGDQVSIIPLDNSNPIYLGCKKAKHDSIIFMDYGCVFKPNFFKKMINKSMVVCSKNIKNSKLDTGCILDDNEVRHIYFDLPHNKFCNVFSLSTADKKKILSNHKLTYFNLLTFEIINTIIDTGSRFIAHQLDPENFIYFNNMRQKNATNKFIKKITH